MTGPYKSVGIPKESKALEGRVALTPSAVGDLVGGGAAGLYGD